MQDVFLGREASNLVRSGREVSNGGQSYNLLMVKLTKRKLFDGEKKRKMCRPRILIESAWFPPFGFDIQEMRFNSS